MMDTMLLAGREGLEPRAQNSAICPAANSTPATPRHTQRPHKLILDNYKWVVVMQKIGFSLGTAYIETLGFRKFALV